MTTYRITSGVHAAGIPVGIIMMETRVPYPPGSPNNARTFDFPVAYEVVEGASMESLIYDPQADLLCDRFIVAGRRLVERGAKVIFGGCGFMVLFQRELAAALPVPVYGSSLLQMPLIATALKPGQSIGIVSASAASLTAQHMSIATSGLEIPHVIAGLEHRPAFKASVHDQTGLLDFDAVSADVVAESLALQAAHPELGAILLECSDLPPYADAVVEATGLPVYDFNTLIRWGHQAVEPPRYPHIRN